MIRSLAVVFAVLLSLSSCLTPADQFAPNAGGDAEPTGLSSGAFPLPSGALHWSSRVNHFGDATVLIENRSTETIRVHLSVPRQEVGTTTTYEERQVGIEEIEYCDPVTQECYITREPIYELVLVKEPVYAQLRVQPRRLTLAAGETAAAHVSRNSSQADLFSTASVLVRVGGAGGDAHTIAVFVGEAADE